MLASMPTWHSVNLQTLLACGLSMCRKSVRPAGIYRLGILQELWGGRHRFRFAIEAVNTSKAIVTASVRLKAFPNRPEIATRLTPA